MATPPPPVSPERMDPRRDQFRASSTEFDALGDGNNRLLDPKPVKVHDASTDEEGYLQSGKQEKLKSDEGQKLTLEKMKFDASSTILSYMIEELRQSKFAEGLPWQVPEDQLLTVYQTVYTCVMTSMVEVLYPAVLMYERRKITTLRIISQEHYMSSESSSVYCGDTETVEVVRSSYMSSSELSAHEIHNETITPQQSLLFTTPLSFRLVPSEVNVQTQHPKTVSASKITRNLTGSRNSLSRSSLPYGETPGHLEGFSTTKMCPTEIPRNLVGNTSIYSKVKLNTNEYCSEYDLKQLPCQSLSSRVDLTEHGCYDPNSEELHILDNTQRDMSKTNGNVPDSRYAFPYDNESYNDCFAIIEKNEPNGHVLQVMAPAEIRHSLFTSEFDLVINNLIGGLIEQLPTASTGSVGTNQLVVPGRHHLPDYFHDLVKREEVSYAIQYKSTNKTFPLLYEKESHLCKSHFQKYDTCERANASADSSALAPGVSSDQLRLLKWPNKKSNSDHMSKDEAHILAGAIVESLFHNLNMCFTLQFKTNTLPVGQRTHQWSSMRELNSHLVEPQSNLPTSGAARNLNLGENNFPIRAIEMAGTQTEHGMITNKVGSISQTHDKTDVPSNISSLEGRDCFSRRIDYENDKIPTKSDLNKLDNSNKHPKHPKGFTTDAKGFCNPQSVEEGMFKNQNNRKKDDPLIYYLDPKSNMFSLDTRSDLVMPSECVAAVNRKAQFQVLTMPGISNGFKRGKAKQEAAVGGDVKPMIEPCASAGRSVDKPPSTSKQDLAGLELASKTRKSKTTKVNENLKLKESKNRSSTKYLEADQLKNVHSMPGGIAEEKNRSIPSALYPQVVDEAPGETTQERMRGENSASHSDPELGQVHNTSVRDLQPTDDVHGTTPTVDKSKSSAVRNVPACDPQNNISNNMNNLVCTIPSKSFLPGELQRDITIPAESLSVSSNCSLMSSEIPHHDTSNNELGCSESSVYLVDAVDERILTTTFERRLMAPDLYPNESTYDDKQKTSLPNLHFKHTGQISDGKDRFKGRKTCDHEKSMQVTREQLKSPKEVSLLTSDKNIAAQPRASILTSTADNRSGLDILAHKVEKSVEDIFDQNAEEAILTPWPFVRNLSDVTQSTPEICSSKMKATNVICNETNLKQVSPTSVGTGMEGECLAWLATCWECVITKIMFNLFRQFSNTNALPEGKQLFPASIFNTISAHVREKLTRNMSEDATEEVTSLNMKRYLKAALGIQQIAESTYRSILHIYETPTAMQSALSSCRGNILKISANVITVELTQCLLYGEIFHLSGEITDGLLSAGSGDYQIRLSQYLYTTIDAKGIFQKRQSHLNNYRYKGRSLSGDRLATITHQINNQSTTMDSSAVAEHLAELPMQKKRRVKPRLCQAGQSVPHVKRPITIEKSEQHQNHCTPECPAYLGAKDEQQTSTSLDEVEKADVNQKTHVRRKSFNKELPPQKTRLRATGRIRKFISHHVSCKSSKSIKIVHCQSNPVVKPEAPHTLLKPQEPPLVQACPSSPHVGTRWRKLLWRRITFRHRTTPGVMPETEQPELLHTPVSPSIQPCPPSPRVGKRWMKLLRRKEKGRESVIPEIKTEKKKCKAFPKLLQSPVSSQFRHDPAADTEEKCHHIVRVAEPGTGQPELLHTPESPSIQPCSPSPHVGKRWKKMFKRRDKGHRCVKPENETEEEMFGAAFPQPLQSPASSQFNHGPASNIEDKYHDTVRVAEPGAGQTQLLHTPVSPSIQPSPPPPCIGKKWNKLLWRRDKGRQSITPEVEPETEQLQKMESPVSSQLQQDPPSNHKGKRRLGSVWKTFVKNLPTVRVTEPENGQPEDSARKMED